MVSLKQMTFVKRLEGYLKLHWHLSWEPKSLTVVFEQLQRLSVLLHRKEELMNNVPTLVVCCVQLKVWFRVVFRLLMQLYCFWA